MNQTTDMLPTFWERNKMLIKGFFIGFLILIMLIPTAFLFGLVEEREQRQQEVIEEISNKWSGSQTIAGPLLVVPYTTTMTNSDGKNVTIKKQAYFLPDRVSINSNITPEIRHRSLYDVSLYRSKTVISGEFGKLPFEKLNIPKENILWNECSLVMGIDDARGLEDEVVINWNDKLLPLTAGVPENTSIKDGLSTPLSFDSTRKAVFSLTLALKGSQKLYFTPVGNVTEVNVASSWPNPAFDGQYLPTSNADITDSGFTAKWKILSISRNYPQYWTGNTKVDISNSAFGVKLIQPTDNYAKTSRSVKYTILFIALTFTIFFFLEIFQKRQVHPLQYILVGIALCVFYTLLLSISEYTSFNTAYLIAAAATVSLISLYVLGIFKKPKIAIGFALALSGLYTYIFVLIQQQDYALLFGSIGLFIILAVIMYYSRKIDWYQTQHQLQNSNSNAV